MAKNLESLRDGPLPALGPTVEDTDADYRFRAQAPREAVAAAVATLIRDLDYDNFKSAVGRVQGHTRESLYHGVWSAALKLQKGG